MAIVGTRAPSADAAETARLAATIARSLGSVVVGALARGIDTAAHRATLAADPDAPTKKPLPATIAVLGSALTALYPAENHDLAEKIKDRGSVVTERLSGAVRPSWLVQRNRIISGLGRRVLIVEFREGKDGSLHTARFALDQGRQVAVWNRWKAQDLDAARRVLDRCGVPSFDLISNEMELIDWLDRTAPEGPGFSEPTLLFERPASGVDREDRLWPVLWPIDPFAGHVLWLIA